MQILQTFSISVDFILPQLKLLLTPVPEDRVKSGFLRAFKQGTFHNKRTDIEKVRKNAPYLRLNAPP